MRFERTDDGVERVATLDVETTHFEPERGEVVAIGVGVHDRGTPGTAADYECFYRCGPTDEADTILAAIDAVSRFDADRLVTYNGRGFDLPFLRDRVAIRGGGALELPFTASQHLDLFADRKERADATGRKWPNLEECLDAYGVTPAETRWSGELVTNGLFGDELGPAYLDALTVGDDTRVDELHPVIDHYLRTDLENNFVVYYRDVGIEFDPIFAGRHATF